MAMKPSVPPRFVVRVFTKGQKRFGDGLEENLQHDLFIEQHNGVQIMGYGEHGVEIGTGQQLGFSFCKPPFPGHVPALGQCRLRHEL
jgi:hypothetical protein